MTDKAQRLAGRIDAVENRCGWIVTHEWKAYFFHARSVWGQMPAHHDIVSFEIDESSGEVKPRAINVKLESQNRSAEFFGKFARFIRERNEEVA